MIKWSLKTIKCHVNEWNYCGQHYKFGLIIEEYYYSILDFPGGWGGKASVYNEGDLGLILGQEDSLEKEMATHSSTLA